MSEEQVFFMGPIARSIVISQDAKRAILNTFTQSVKRVHARNIKVTYDFNGNVIEKIERSSANLRYDMFYDEKTYTRALEKFEHNVRKARIPFFEVVMEIFLNVIQNHLSDKVVHLFQGTMKVCRE